MSIRVYIVEDHPVMRQSLADYLCLDPEFELCGSAESAEQALEDLPSARAALVLLDLSLPGRTGLELLEEIRDRWQLPCVILSGHGEGSYVGRAFAAGARGYLLKGRPHEVPVAIRQVMDGQIYVSDALRDSLNGEGSTGR